jgi:polysaccharide biosynthesis transport protein
MELIVIFKLLLKRIRPLLIIPIIAGIAAFIFTLYSPKSYQSTAKIATNFTTNRQIKLTDEKSNAWDSGIKFNNLIATMSGELFLSLLSYELIIHDLTNDEPFRTIKDSDNILVGKSSEDLDTIIFYFKDKLEKMEILSLYDKYESRLDTLLKDYEYDPAKLGKSLNINRVGGTDFVEINFRSENPHLSALAVNTLCREYIRYDSARAVNQSGRSVVFFSDLVKEKKKLLDEKTNAVNAYKSVNDLFNIDRVQLNTTQISALEESRIEQMNKIQRLRISISNVDKQIQVIKKNKLESSSPSNARILELRDRINNLNKLFIDDDSKDQDLENKIIELRQLLRKEMEKLPGSSAKFILSEEELLASKDELLLDLEIEKAALQTLNKIIAKLKQNVSSAERKEASVESLELEAETASKEYLQAVEKYNMEKNKALISKSPIQVIQIGQPNYEPSLFKSLLVIGLAVSSSFFLCALTFLIIEFADVRIKTPSKFKAYSGLNLLGTINLIDSKKTDLKSLLHDNLKNSITDKNKHLLRKIRYEIEHSGGKVILFTSTKTGEGKTYLVLSISHSLSLLNKRILIIDTNFKNNTLTNMLIEKPRKNRLLTDNQHPVTPSTDGKSKNESDQNIILTTINGNVDIIGNKGDYDSPSEIFARIDFASFIKKMRESYDYIFMEGPSLNEFSDTKELAIYADKVLPIFSAFSIIKGIDRESIDYLKNLDGKLMDSILNMTDSKALD